eukprot:TRINITY_DN5103_c0_g1_i2.p1 TRINITY_DN5103_c0_g1~~TRINITY_DN5103_c0_g1_i2.p1  ORF type:complete len:152 (+),score=32.47 TRINITY_DN5103_c0_g1_i2:580-1035(+)
MMDPVSPTYSQIVSASSRFVSEGLLPEDEEVKYWRGQEWNLFLENLPMKLLPTQIEILDGRFKFSASKNWDVKAAFLTIVAYSGYEPLFKEIEGFLKSIGRMMYLRPLYSGLLNGNCKEGKQVAKRIFKEARDLYHPIAQGVVESLFAKLS